MYAALKNRLYQQFFPLREPVAGAIDLVQRRVFILPTRQGLLYAATMLLMLIGSINYSLGLGYILTFLLVGLGITAMLHTFRDLAHLRVSAGRVAPVFAGELACFAVRVQNPTPTDRYEIGLTRDRVLSSFANIARGHDALMSIDVPALRRGRLRPGRLTLFTFYPLGLFRAWSYLDLDVQCIVYPRPAPPGAGLPPEESAPGDGALLGQGQEDFSGLRPYHPGDSPRHIAWKAAARDPGLLTKQFSGRADAELWLDWTQLPTAMSVEHKLSQLARWVIDAHACGAAFGLRLPDAIIPMGGGDAQRERCLEALALFEPQTSDHSGPRTQRA